MRFFAILVCAVFITSCGAGGGSSGNASTSSTTGNSGMAVGIQLPKGVTYDPATGAISGAFAQAGASNPKAFVGQAYITQISVTMSGGTIPSRTITLSSGNLASTATFTVNPGESYDFSVSILTSNPAPNNIFSGGTLTPVVAPPAGQSVVVNISVSVNGPPVAPVFTSSDLAPGSGSVNLTCSATTDPDAGDVITYSIYMTGANGRALNINPATPGVSNAYDTGTSSRVDLECKATDQLGAFSVTQLSLNAGLALVSITTVQGHVKYGAATAVPGATVQIYNLAGWSGGIANSATTDGSGSYSFTGLSYATFDSSYIDLSAAYPGFSSGCSISGPTATCDFQLTHPATVTISGTNASPNMTFTIIPPAEAATCQAYIYQSSTLIASSGTLTGSFVWAPSNTISGMTAGNTYLLNFTCYDAGGIWISYLSTTSTSFVY